MEHITAESFLKMFNGKENRDFSLECMACEVRAKAYIFTLEYIGKKKFLPNGESDVEIYRGIIGEYEDFEALEKSEISQLLILGSENELDNSLKTYIEKRDNDYRFRTYLMSWDEYDKAQAMAKDMNDPMIGIEFLKGE